jgi:putative transposase
MVEESVGGLAVAAQAARDGGHGPMVRAVAETLMAAEAGSVCGAPYRQTSAERVNHRNGTWERRWDTRVGTMDLGIPRLRKGSYYPDWLLEPRRQAERAL